MSISTPYATPSEYRQVIGMTDPGRDAEIEIDLRAVSRYLDGEMRRFFSRDVIPVPRIYVIKDNVKLMANEWEYYPTVCQDVRILSVNDMSAPPTQVRVDTRGDGTFATVLTTADYELLPRNAMHGPEPWPFTHIALTPWGQLGRFFPDQRVEVTARFGWPAVPEAIRRAAIHITAILRLETPRATKRIAELGDAVETSQQAQNIVKQLTYQYKVWLV